MSMSKGYKSSKMSDSRLKKISLKLIDTSSYWSNSETSWLLWPTGWMREMRLSSTCKRSWTLMTRYTKRLRWTLNLSQTEFRSLKNPWEWNVGTWDQWWGATHTSMNGWVETLSTWGQLVTQDGWDWSTSLTVISWWEDSRTTSYYPVAMNTYGFRKSSSTSGN